MLLHADKQRDTYLDTPLLWTDLNIAVCHSSTGFATATALLPVQSVVSLYLQGN